MRTARTKRRMREYRRRRESYFEISEAVTCRGVEWRELSGEWIESSSPLEVRSGRRRRRRLDRWWSGSFSNFNGFTLWFFGVGVGVTVGVWVDNFMGRGGTLSSSLTDAKYRAIWASFSSASLAIKIASSSSSSSRVLLHLKWAREWWEKRTW